MVYIEPGTFMMGSPSDERGRDSNEGPQHEVTLSKGFYMGKHEVTIGQYVAFLEDTNKDSGVDWDDIDCPLSRNGDNYSLHGEFGRTWDQPMTSRKKVGIKNSSQICFFEPLASGRVVFCGEADIQC
jgi:formylglycine-generating enzyme required for sulfatase activity